ncbi:MAG: hypothetical protein RPR97_13905 [Colwellia sp.]|jgi:hypothetical protein
MFDDVEVKARSVSDWYPILNWNTLPNFGSCHTNSSLEDFTKSYYRDEKIVTLYNNICETLKGNVAAANIRLAGDPGAGKTSFLYAIKKISESERYQDILSGFFFYIFHINKADDVTDEHYKTEIIYHIKRAWKEFYFICGHKDKYSRFKNQDLSDKELTNKLSDYYKNHKSEFKKIMVFAVDDVDLLPGGHVGTIVDLVLKNIEIGSVKKWLVIRKTTFDNYSAATKKKIEQFFPDPYQYPSVSLQRIVKFRIEHTSGQTNWKNPFSEKLCDSIVNTICEGNMREGLSLLKSILEENGPGNFSKSVDDTVIHKYLDSCSVKTLASSQKLIDLHAAIFRLTQFPIAIDLLICSKYHTSVDIIFGAVNDCLLARNINSSYLVGDKDSVYKLKQSDFNDTLKLLTEHGLITSPQKNRIQATEKGLITAIFCTGEFYYDYCFEKNKIYSNDPTYWLLAKKQINHKEIMDTYQVWRNKR